MSDDETVERVLLREVLTWLRDPRLSQWNYMEGTAFYVDKHAMAEKIEAALSALPRAEADDGWRTIESASKWSTPVLLYFPAMYLPGKSWFEQGARWGISVGYYYADDDNPDTSGWRALDGDTLGQPTHWRPLPAPPAQAGER